MRVFKYMEINIDYTKFTVKYEFDNLDCAQSQIILGPPATVSDSELLFQALSCLSVNQRSALNSMKIEVSEGTDILLLGSLQFGWLRFSPGLAFNDDERCKGCGNAPVDGINPLCHHPSGCEKWRQIKDSTPYE